MELTLRVFSIFSSIQGESTRAGRPCVFVRLAGCPLKCVYCDTVEARGAEGEEMTVARIVELVGEEGHSLVEVTGGEPLAQEGTPRLLTRLADAGFEVMLETSGAFSVLELDPRVRVVMDVKTPGSGMVERIHLPNLEREAAWGGEIKFVITSRRDFDWCVDIVKRHGLDGFGSDDSAAAAAVLFSPAEGMVQPSDLAAWIMSSGLEVRLQLQLHRLIWPEYEGEK